MKIKLISENVRYIFFGVAASLSVLLAMPALGQTQTNHLLVGYTATFQFSWSDKGSGGDADGSFWKPVAPAGYYLVGDYAQNSYADPNGKAIVMVVQEKQSGALAVPENFELVWKDSGSGANRDGSMWNMVCPGDYVSLGSVSQAGYDKPDVNAYRCVRGDLTAAGDVGDAIWLDKGTGADTDFGSWGIAASTSGTFIAQASHDKPKAAKVLLLP